jgi:hypothetical protein
VLQTIIKEVVNVSLVMLEIPTIEMDAESNATTNVQPILNVKNQRCASRNKESLNVFQPVIAFDAVPMQFALLTITLLNVNVLQVHMPVIQMISKRVVSKFPVFITTIVLQLNYATD